jgi:hypothetical protein
LPTRHSDAPSWRTELNSPSLANLRYQQHCLQQTEKGTKKLKRKNGVCVLERCLAATLVLLLTYLHLSRAIEAGLFSRAFRKKLSELTCFLSERVLFTA